LAKPKQRHGKILVVWLILTNSLYFLFLLELGLQSYYQAQDEKEYQASLDYRRFEADTYQNNQWPKAYYHEHRQAYVSRWQPYVHWRREAYNGEYINIDNKGIRKTWQPEFPDLTKGKPFQIFVFGGSTIWGTGARDDFTIPSQLAKQLAKKGHMVEVTNLGESSYTSTQEVLTLMDQLRQGKRPDLVIFYDGFNDATAALVQNRAGIPFNEQHRKNEYNMHKKKLSTLLREHVWPKMALKRFIQSLAASLRSRDEFSYHNLNSEKLAKEVVDVYRFNLELLQNMQNRYQFTLLNYWQPNIFDKSRLTPYEEKQTHLYPEFDLKGFYREVNQELAAAGLEQHSPFFHDISGIFQNTREPVFVDLIHLGERGNQIIAARMMEDILPILPVVLPYQKPLSLGSEPK